MQAWHIVCVLFTINVTWASKWSSCAWSDYKRAAPFISQNNLLSVFVNKRDDKAPTGPPLQLSRLWAYTRHAHASTILGQLIRFHSNEPHLVVRQHSDTRCTHIRSPETKNAIKYLHLHIAQRDPTCIDLTIHPLMWKWKPIHLYRSLIEFLVQIQR